MLSEKLYEYKQEEMADSLRTITDSKEYIVSNKIGNLLQTLPQLSTQTLRLNISTGKMKLMGGHIISTNLSGVINIVI